MNFVYLVMGSVQYEGETVLGVFSTRDKAEEYLARKEVDWLAYDQHQNLLDRAERLHYKGSKGNDMYFFETPLYHLARSLQPDLKACDYDYDEMYVVNFPLDVGEGNLVYFNSPDPEGMDSGEYKLKYMDRNTAYLETENGSIIETSFERVSNVRT